MLIHEKTYDLHDLARYNLHIHSIHSGCAKPEMEIRNIIEEARKCSIEVIAITDHHNDKDHNIIENNRKLKEQAEGHDDGIKILYGAELSAYGVNKYLDEIEMNQGLDYRLYSYNHYHLDYWEHPEDKSPRGYVNHGLEVLTRLIKSGRADCIAHPFIGRFIRCFQDRTLVTKEITDNELGDILQLGRDNNVAWEINLGAMMGDPEFARRYWNIGKEVGVVFHFGTDAHRLVNIDTRQAVEQLKSILE